MCLSFCVASALMCNILFGTYTSTHLRYICPRTAKSTTLRTNDTAALIYDSEESHFPFPRSTSGRHPSSNGRNHVKKNTLERRLYYKIYVTVCVCYTTKNSYMKRGQAVLFFFCQNKIRQWFIYLGNVSGVLPHHVLPMYYFSINSSAELLTPTHPPLMVCAPTHGFNYGSKSPLPDRAGELHWRSVLCASVISFPLGAVARLVSHAAGQLRTRHRSLSSPDLHRARHSAVY